MLQDADLLPIEIIERRILLIRGQKVMIDTNLANLYGISTKALNQAVKRNKERFPSDFMLQLTKEEKDELVTVCDRFKNLKHSVVLPYAFTEHEALMVASIINTRRAVEVSLFVVRAFVRLRELLSSHKELVHKFEELERHIQSHDKSIQSLFDAIRQLMAPPPLPPKRKIGF